MTVLDCWPVLEKAVLHDLDISQRRYALGVVMLQPVGTLIEEDNLLDFPCTASR